jgi:hypothetical protein
VFCFDDLRHNFGLEKSGAIDEEGKLVRINHFNRYASIFGIGKGAGFSGAIFI